VRRLFFMSYLTWSAALGLWACSAPTPQRPVAGKDDPARAPSVSEPQPSPKPTVDTEAPPLSTPDTGAVSEVVATPDHYPWLEKEVADTVLSRFAPPEGYARIEAGASSLAFWLRHLPLLSGRPGVLLFNGQRKGNQSAQEAVIDIDVGQRDLQQCADAVIRLRAEFLRVSGRDEAICFKFTNGSDAVWSRWQEGYRPVLEGRKVGWQRLAAPGSSYAVFKRYLTRVFQYAGSASLEREMKPVDASETVQPGDVFIEGGFPGHAVMVVDVAENKKRERVFLLLQSYMPAQQMHVLKNPNDPSLSPWYRYKPDEPLETPEWRFNAGKLRRFSGRRCER
jgi:hypothetical protein